MKEDDKETDSEKIINTGIDEKSALTNAEKDKQTLSKPEKSLLTNNVRE